MDFVHKRPILAATLAVFITAVLLLVGNGMNPVWPLMWIAFIPVLLLAVLFLAAVVQLSTASRVASGGRI